MKKINLNGVEIPISFPQTKPTLLWSQSNVSTTAKTVPSTDCAEPLTDYEWFLVRTAYTSSDKTGGYFYVHKDVTCSMSIVGIGSTHYAYTRRVTITDASIAFTTGYRNGTSGGGYAIPMEVWGVV